MDLFRETDEFRKTDKFRKTEVAQILGESPRKIQFWVDQGLVIPDVIPPSGKGRAVIFSVKNLIEFEMIRILQNKCKLKLSFIRSFLNSLRETEQDFYSNPEWGKSLDIFYFELKGIDMQDRQGLLRIIRKNGDTFVLKNGRSDIKFGDELEALVNRGYCFNAVMLGKIKLMAMENLKDLDLL
jgi:DNA-binding transcriptional MerR regulator